MRDIRDNNWFLLLLQQLFLYVSTSLTLVEDHPLLLPLTNPRVPEETCVILRPSSIARWA
eukprot:6152256-Ditylum_brightwellii.AAC.1